MSTLRVVERVEEPAIICRKCDRVMVGGTLPPRHSLCGGCANNDARARTNRYQKRTRRQKRVDHLLDRFLPITLQVSGGLIVAGAVGYWLARALGWAQ